MAKQKPRVISKAGRPAAREVCPSCGLVKDSRSKRAKDCKNYFHVSKVGRPTEYYPQLCEEIIEFFDRDLTRISKRIITTKSGSTIEEEVELPNQLPTFNAFAHKIGHAKSQLLVWCKTYPDFQAAYMRAKDLQEAFLMANTLNGKFDSRFAIFTAKNILDWKDRSETDITTKGESIKENTLPADKADKLSKILETHFAKNHTQAK